MYLSTALVDLGRFFSFLILYTVGRTPWTGDQPVARPLPTHRTIQTQNKRKQTSVPRVVFEPTIPVFERAKTVHASDRAATVIGEWRYGSTNLLSRGTPALATSSPGNISGHHWTGSYVGPMTCPRIISCL
jgi:hypothetical protein